MTWCGNQSSLVKDIDRSEERGREGEGEKSKSKQKETTALPTDRLGELISDTQRLESLSLRGVHTCDKSDAASSSEKQRRPSCRSSFWSPLIRMNSLAALTTVHTLTACILFFFSKREDATHPFHSFIHSYTSTFAIQEENKQKARANARHESCHRCPFSLTHLQPRRDERGRQAERRYLLRHRRGRRRRLAVVSVADARQRQNLGGG